MPWSCGLQIRISSGPGRGTTLPLDSQHLKVGRARTPGDRASGWLYLNDDTVSRLHAELLWEPARQAFRLVHRSQTNLTKLNGEPVEEDLLQPGDLIELGKTTLELQRADTRWAGAPSEEVAPVTVPGLGSQPSARSPASRGFAPPEPRSKAPAPAQRLGPVLCRLRRLEDDTQTQLDSARCDVLPGVHLTWRDLPATFALTVDAGTEVEVVRSLDGVSWTARASHLPILLQHGDHIVTDSSEHCFEVMSEAASTVRKIKLEG